MNVTQDTTCTTYNVKDKEILPCSISVFLKYNSISELLVNKKKKISLNNTSCQVCKGLKKC